MAAVEFHPVTAERWSDLELLFGERGACGGCWCMYWRLTASQFNDQKGAPNRAALKTLVDAGEVPGILAYSGRVPVGWCSVAPREQFVRLQNPRTLRAPDPAPVWSVVCLFVKRGHRRQGMSVRLLEAVCDYVGRQGGKWVEGYPVVPKKDVVPDVFAWTGLPAAFLRAGFEEIAQPSPSRKIVRRAVTPPR